MSREFLVLWAGRHRRPDWEQLCAGYRQRISHHATVKDQWIKVKTGSEDPKRKRVEGEALRAALPEPVYSIALDVRGKAPSSRQWADKLSRLRDEWPHPVAFLIGSDLGLDSTLIEAANQVISLGSMTFGHELARLALYEQLYRAVSIQAGISYHRDRF